MKKIEAVIQLSKLNEVQDALADIGIDVMTVCEVRGFGRQNRHKETYRCKEYTINFLPMIKIDLVVADPTVEQAVKVLIRHNANRVPCNLAHYLQKDFAAAVTAKILIDDVQRTRFVHEIQIEADGKELTLTATVSADGQAEPRPLPVLRLY
jgi:nitrogen regulatory protein P-II 1